MRSLRIAPPLLALLLATVLRAAVPFPQAESDLPADPAIRFGALPNGLRYAVMHNHEPQGRVSLRLVVFAGSFEETEAQRGLAHFLEHMAFNGSTHYAPGTLVEKLQRLGMGFGADTNAATSFDHTIYQLEMPDTAPATLAEGLQILADYGGGLLLEPAMINKERGIILSEERTRDSVSYRTLVTQLQFMESGTRVPERLPIGLDSVIRGSDRTPFKAFYDTWYRPELMAVVVVGDVDAAAVEKQVVGAFSPLVARSPEPDPVNLGSVPVFSGPRVLFHREPEAPDTRITIGETVPFVRQKDTGAYRLSLLPRLLAFAMLNERLSILAKKENAPFIRASAEVDEPFNLYRETTIQVSAKAEQWRQALDVAEQELRRALAFGFRPDELRQAVAEFRNELEQAAKTAPTRRSDDLAGEIADSLVDREVFTSPAEDLALYGPALDQVTTGECAVAFGKAWAAPGRYVFVAGNAVIPGDANAAVAAEYAQSARVNLKATAAQENLAWGYTNFGPPGTVATRRDVPDLGITEVVLSNGVRLNLKKTDFEANTVHISARLGTGKLTEPASEPGLAVFTSLTFSAGGLGKHSVDDLRRILAGKTVGAQLVADEDAFVLQGDTNHEDLALEFQLLTASIADPGFRPESLRVARKRIETAYLGFQHTERGPLALKVDRLVAGGDPRFGLPPKEQMIARNLQEERTWLGPQLASGPLEVAIVGDQDIDATIQEAARTLGALPARDGRPALNELKRVAFPTRPFTEGYAVDTKIPKTLVLFYWPTSDGLDIGRARKLDLVASILADRLRVRVREQLSGTYSPDASSEASDVFPGFGYIAASVVVEPSRAKEIGDVVVAAAQDLAAHGATQDEFERALNPALTAIRESERTNGYWLSVLSKAQEKPEVLAWARTRLAQFQAMTREDVSALARQYLGSEHASRVVIYPSPLAAPVRSSTAPPPLDG